jgi:hypothetical protein
MLEFLAADQNLPFSVALAVMLCIALLEGIATLLGAGISGLLDNLIPDFDVDVDIDASETVTATPLSKLLGWLRIGQVPALMLLVIFLTAFGLIGLGVQSTSQNVIGLLLPGWLASIPAVIFSMPIVRLLGSLLNKFMPKDETEAVSEDSFIGRIATITLGAATVGNPAQAKLKDLHGHTHYLMVEPDTQREQFNQGDQVLILEKIGTVFRAIRNTSEALVDKQVNK